MFAPENRGKLIEKTDEGIDISMNAIANVAHKAASSCYGVGGLAGRTSSWVEKVQILLKDEDYVKGVYARKGRKGYEVDVYIVCAYGVKLTEVALEVQKMVRYELEKTFGMKFPSVNVFVQDLKEVD